MTWTQVYNPLGNLYVSAVVAAIPVVVLLGSLAFFHIKAHMAASNSSGGVMGKMVDAQSIVVAGVATGQQSEEGNILRYVFFHSLALAILVGILVYLQAYVFPGMIPAYTGTP